MQLPGLVQFRKCTLSDKALAEAVVAGLAKMYKEPCSVPSRHIPARPDEDFDLLVGEMVYRSISRTPNSYLLDWEDRFEQEVCAVATKYENKKPCLWAIRRGGSCMRKSDGVFIHEPSPSNMDDDFFAECRFESFEDAERVYLSFKA